VTTALQIVGLLLAATAVWVALGLGLCQLCGRLWPGLVDARWDAAPFAFFWPLMVLGLMIYLSVTAVADRRLLWRAWCRRRDLRHKLPRARTVRW
jgi:hypothetical protein